MDVAPSRSSSSNGKIPRYVSRLSARFLVLPKIYDHEGARTSGAVESEMNTADLQKHRILGHEVFYVPDFVTVEEEQYLLRKIRESPRQKWKQLSNRRLQLWGGEVSSKNTLFTQPMPSFINVYPDIITRLQATGAFEFSPHGAPNHVILNEYSPGQGIMPHEDGPAYYPVVATISLGSHSVFHYYQYTEDTHSMNASALSFVEGRPIDPSPVLSVLLEPRSVIITTGAFYTSHLHGIQEIEEDRITPGHEGGPPLLTELGVKIDNWEMLTDEEAKTIIQNGGVLRRGTRYSLTCRDVKKAMSVKSFA